MKRLRIGAAWALISLLLASGVTFGQTVYTEGKIKPAVQGGRVADAADIAVSGSSDPLQATITALQVTPQYLESFTAAAVSVASTEVVLQTLRITPRSSSTRIHLSAHVDISVTAGAGQSNRDMAFELRAYRGSTRLPVTRAKRETIGANRLAVRSIDLELLDSPNTTSEVVYQIRGIRLNGAASYSVSQRQILANEVQ